MALQVSLKKKSGTNVKLLGSAARRDCLCNGVSKILMMRLFGSESRKCLGITWGQICDEQV